jgi:hypothetical protein
MNDMIDYKVLADHLLDNMTNKQGHHETVWYLLSYGYCIDDIITLGFDKDYVVQVFEEYTSQPSRE